MPLPLLQLRDPATGTFSWSKLLLVTAVCLLAAVTFGLAQSLTPWWTEGTKLRIFDFAYHIHLVSQFWYGNIANPYDPDAQRQAVSNLIGSEWKQAMPIGISPSALLLWFPFAALAQLSLRTAHAAWIALSVALASGVTLLAARNRDGRIPMLGAALLFVCFFTKTCFVTVVLGQTSLVALALLILIWRRPAATADRATGQIAPSSKGADSKGLGSESPTETSDIRDAFLLSCLALKPTYLLLGLSSLAIQRRYRAALYGVVLFGIETALVLPRLGLGGILDFVTALGIYSSGNVPSYYRDSIVLDTMVTFTSAFTPVFSSFIVPIVGPLLGGAGADPALSRTMTFTFSRIVALAGLLVPPLILYRRGREIVSSEQQCVAFITALGAVLLFSPYLGSYEDLLFAAGVGVLIRSGVQFPRLNARWMIYTMLVWLYFNRDEALQGTPLAVQWLLKLGLIAGLFQLARERGSRKQLP